MSNQNISTLITIFGTLVGTLLGIIGTNYYTIRHEKLTRNTKAIEEAYTIIDTIQASLEGIILELTSANAEKRQTIFTPAKWMELQPIIDRLNTVVHLYLSKRIDDLNEFRNAITDLWQSMLGYGQGVMAYDVDQKTNDALFDARADFFTAKEKIQSSLAKMVR